MYRGVAGDFHKVHPQGHAVLTRNVSYDEQTEWSCVHDLYEELDDMKDNEEADESDDYDSDGRNEHLLQASIESNQHNQSRKRKFEPGNYPIEEFAVRPSSSQYHRFNTNSSSISGSQRRSSGRRLAARRGQGRGRFATTSQPSQGNYYNIALHLYAYLISMAFLFRGTTIC